MIFLSYSVSKSSLLESLKASSSKEMSSAMDEVQDFSMPNKNKQPQQTKSKLDDMLSKLMQRKNCVSKLVIKICMLIKLW